MRDRMRTTTAVPIVAAALWTVAAGLTATAGAPEVHFARVRALKEYASEMPDPPGSKAITRTVTVVDLTTQKILFTEPGIDAYWSNDGTRMIYRRMSRSGDQVAIRHEETGAIAHAIAPVNLGDYYSWAVRDGRNLILTIMSNYYYLDGDQGVMPFARVPPCPGIGVGERPLISKDGRRITTFVRGDIVVRDPEPTARTSSTPASRARRLTSPGMAATLRSTWPSRISKAMRLRSWTRPGARCGR